MVNLLPYAIAWVVLVLVVIALAFIRKNISAEEDDTLHLGGGSEQAIAHQQDTAKKLAKLDLYGKVLTAVAVVTGVALGVLYAWQMWEASATAGMK